MKYYSMNKAEVARYVEGRLEVSRRGSVLTMTIQRDTSGDFYVLTVIEGLLAGTEKNLEQTSLEPPMNTSQENIPAG